MRCWDVPGTQHLRRSLRMSHCRWCIALLAANEVFGGADLCVLEGMSNWLRLLDTVLLQRHAATMRAGVRQRDYKLAWPEPGNG